MKHAYKEIALRPASLKLIGVINDVIDNYLAQGFMLSVRQLYYQLVARAMIENTEQSYKRIAGIINDGRLMGLIDWDAIEDRNRDIEKRASWTSGAQILNVCANQFHMDMWANQEHRVFVIVEKAALAGVLDGVCKEYDIPLLAARGYPSVSIVREMALQYLVPSVKSGQRPLVIHMGDHDPSGIDMTRDLDDRLDLFLGRHSTNYELRRIALTMPQIEEVNPPPNPAKTTDSRFQSYMQQYGDESWELDALEPRYLVTLLRDTVDPHINQEQWKEREQEISDIKDRLREAANDFDEE